MTKKIILCLFILTLSILYTQTIQAVTVSSDVNFEVKYNNGYRNYEEQISARVNKVFNLIKVGQTVNLPLNFNMNLNEKVNLKSENATGEWIKLGGRVAHRLSDDPYSKLPNKLYPIAPVYQRFSSVVWFATMFYQKDGITKLISQNPEVVNCVDTICTAISAGTTTIRVNFTQNPIYFISTVNVSWLGNSEWVDRDAYGYYGFSDVTYTVTVPSTTNTPHVTTCTGASGITSNSATINWSYVDVDNDVQTQYQVQLSKKAYNDSTFSDTDIVFASTSINSNNSHTFSALEPNTTYFARVRTYNGANTWSLYSSCGSGFTTTPGGTNSCSCNGTRNLTCTTSSGVPTTVTNSPSCALSGYCSPSRDATNTIFTITPINRLGNITYSHSGASPVTRNDSLPYTHTTAKTGGVQSLAVTLTDFDGKTFTIPSSQCSIGTVPPVVTLPDPTITIKKPKIILNGKCKIDWTITYKPAGMTCNLLKGNTNIESNIEDVGSRTFNNLTSNTRYTISCSGAGITTISSSTICRINPNINEI